MTVCWGWVSLVSPSNQGVGYDSPRIHSIVVLPFFQTLGNKSVFVSYATLRSAQHQGGYAHPNVVTSIVTAIGGRRDLKTPSGEKWRGRFRSRLVRDGCPGRGTWALKGRGGGGVTGGGGSCRRRGRVLPVKHGPPSASASALLYRHHSSGVPKCGKSVVEERTVIAKNV